MKHVPEQGKLKEDAVVESVEVVMDKEALEVAENVLLGMKVLQTAPTLV